MWFGRRKNPGNPKIAVNLYKVDVVVGDQAKKAKGVDRVSQKKATTQLIQGIAPLDRDLVEHVYEPNSNTSSESAVQTQEEESQTRPKDSKRKLPREISTMSVRSKSINYHKPIRNQSSQNPSSSDFNPKVDPSPCSIMRDSFVEVR
ncbi:hypothetical protein Q3G72_012797 [Acer saccharum]|nr:hypothetical protein Q3G72_012797 [Acer saccharum]